MAIDLRSFVLKMLKQLKADLFPLLGREISKHRDRRRHQDAIPKQAFTALLDTLELSLDLTPVIHH